MLNLSLSVCPICDSSHSVFRQSATVQDREMVWYECQKCSSFLLWAGEDQWVYQKVGRPEKAHLLKQTLTTAELEAMAEATAEKLAKAAEEDEPEWGARVNTDWRRKPAGYPRWARESDAQRWGDEGLFVWHRDSKTITKLRPTQAVRLLDFLRTEEAWKEQGIEVFETPVWAKLDDPDWKPEDPRVNVIALAPSQVQELLELLADKESELRQMAKEEEEDTQRRWAQVFDLLLSLRKRAKTDELESENDEE